MQMATNGSRVLVTGASGYIATHVVRMLQEQGYRVRATVRSLKNEKKVKPLYDLCPNAKYPLELVEADLLNEESWVAAVAGCDYVQHLASPFPASNPANEDEIIKPAVDGTLSVLKACGEGVKRVVLTSSVAAINAGFLGGPRPWTEADWTDLKDTPSTYIKSKTMAEKAAWDYMKGLPDGKKFELAVINPGFVMGPVLCGGSGTSMDLTRQLMQSEMPALPKINSGFVDVRDVALAHVNAMTIPEAASNRHILVTTTLSFRDMAMSLDSEFRSQGYSVPTREMPNFLVKFLGLFMSDMTPMVPMVGLFPQYDNTRMQSVLGIKPQDAKNTMTDMAYSMVEAGYIKKTEQYTGPKYTE